MVRKDIIIVILISAFIITLGVVGLRGTDNTLQGNFYDGQKLHYDITIASANQPLNTFKHIEIRVDKADPEKKILSYSITSDGQKASKNSFTVLKSNNGSNVSINSTIPIIHEIQPEIPNLLPLPEKFQDPSWNHWKQTFNRSGTYASSDGLIEYKVVGISDFAGIGMKTVVTKSGSFNCTGVKQIVNYSIQESITSANGTKTRFEKLGNFNGENWFDQNSKLLVYSSFDNHKVTVADVSEANRGILGCEEMYREIPSNVHITTELVDV